ncbi:hypothetical protein P171DRAFT_428058 [Karstenula rhodostoma CBS 690.94]|uniref:N-acetyltransferase domain-containing protein n=1 Tax=Karstenula rhodostoma CBS 690.94 TaxID=1392251 RepID=A0A9P4PV85_9PLEO|nr:hypothetical protein P171DRAFT_428058 [Karstenula rhodostoma CBS 690.94]
MPRSLVKAPQHSPDTNPHRTVRELAAMLDFSFYITTPRLAITYFNPSKESHIALTLELYKDYTTVDENGNTKPTIPDRAAAIDMMETRSTQIETSGYGRYCVSVLPPAESHEDTAKRVENATPVGLVGLNLRGPDTPQLPDIGFNLLPAARGKGYAAEAVKGLSDYYDREKGVTELLGYCDDDNEASMKVLRRAGFELLGERNIRALQSPGQVSKGKHPLKLLVWVRGLKKDPKEYGL